MRKKKQQNWRVRAGLGVQPAEARALTRAGAFGARAARAAVRGTTPALSAPPHLPASPSGAARAGRGRCGAWGQAPSPGPKVALRQVRVARVRGGDHGHPAVLDQQGPSDRAVRSPQARPGPWLGASRGPRGGAWC